MSAFEPARSGTHEVPFVMETVESCPICDQLIPPEKVAAVKGRLVARDRHLTQDVTMHLQREFTTARERDQARAAQTLTEVRQQAAANLAEARALTANAEARVRSQLTQEFEQAIALRITEVNEAHAAALRQSEERHAQATHAHNQIVSELKSKLAETQSLAKAQIEAAAGDYEQREQRTRSQLEETVARLTAAESERKKVAQQFQALKDGHAAELSHAVQETRDALEKDKISAVHAEQTKRLDETQKLSAQLDELQRQLARKTADELGEGAELDLFEELKTRFEGDVIRRVPKGTPGADIVHEIRENGIICGKIVYDSKNRKDWKTEYATKLRSDQIAERADHAILSTNKFPAGTKQLHVRDHVIIACPARVVAVATLLREHVVQMHTLRASNESREEKTQELYAFITSPRCAQLFETVNAQITALEQIDAAELRAHQATWERRGKTVKKLEKAHGDLRFEVQRIVGALEGVENT